MIELHFDHPLPASVPESLPVFSTQRPSASQKTLKATAKRLDLPPVRYGPEFRYVDDWRIARQGPVTIAINRRSGALRLRHEERHGRELDQPFRISKRRLTSIGRKFIDRAGLVDRSPDELPVVKITHMKTRGASLEGEETPEQILDAGVIFGRRIDEVPVTGFGGFVMVNIAHDATVVAAEKIWRPRADVVDEVEVLQPDYALEAFERRLRRRGVEGRVRVLRADFGYFEAGDRQAQKFLEPTYAFLYEVPAGEFLYKSVEVIPAVARPRQRWSQRKRFPAHPVTQRRDEPVH